MSLLRFAVAGAVAVQALVLAARASAQSAGLRQAAALRRRLLASPAAAVAAQCAAPAPAGCELSLWWRVGGDWTRVCAPAAPARGDPRLAPARYWRLRLDCGQLPALAWEVFR